MLKRFLPLTLCLLLLIALPTIALAQLEPLPQPVMDATFAALTAQTGQSVSAETVSRMDYFPQEFPDASLGCAQEGEMYAQVITPGYQVLVTFQGVIYDYRVAQDASNVVLCLTIPDRDSDTIDDSFDACPDEAGDPNTLGCPLVTTTVLPANLTPITAANAASVTALNRLTVVAPRIAFSAAGDGTIGVGAYDQVLLYNTSATDLSPTAQIDIQVQGNKIALFNATTGETRLAVSALAAADSTFFVQVFGGNPLTTLQVLAVGQSTLNSFAFNPNGMLLATSHGSAQATTPDNTVKLWDVATAGTEAVPPVATLAHDSQVNMVVFSPAGNLLASTTGSGMVYLWDVSNPAAAAAPLATLPANTNAFFILTGLAFSPDGSLLAVGGDDGQVRVYDVASRTERYVVQAVPADVENGIVTAVAFSPDGSLLAAGGGVPFMESPSPQASAVTLWDAASGTPVASLTNHTALVLDLAFSTDGRLLASGGDTSVWFWGIAG
ncbi:MAG: hypothetical protein H7175_19240 [Burkholderiales bacterium]|nr:hypothetical protein [Anaerolineae bacterium]